MSESDSNDAGGDIRCDIGGDSSRGDASAEARLRIEAYSTLAGLLSAPPTQAALDHLRHSSFAADDNAPADSLAALWRRVRALAAEIAPDALDDEYHALFIGLGRGEVVPYGSWHLTGFLMEKPLSALRDDLNACGIERDPQQKDPEDHIAALCEAMALLIAADDIAESRERAFFARHIDSWAERFFAQLQRAESAHFYRAVGAFGARFLALERDYLAAAPDSARLAPDSKDALASARAMQ